MEKNYTKWRENKHRHRQDQTYAQLQLERRRKSTNRRDEIEINRRIHTELGVGGRGQW